MIGERALQYASQLEWTAWTRRTALSRIIIEDEGWKAIMADPELARARRKLSFHEIRLIVHLQDWVPVK